LGDGLDEGRELVTKTLSVVVRFPRGDGGLLIGTRSRRIRVANLRIELPEDRVEMIGEQRWQGRIIPAVDTDPGDEIPLLAGEGEIDRPVFVQSPVIGEEILAKPISERGLLARRRREGFPRRYGGTDCLMSEGIGVSTARSDQEDTCRKRRFGSGG
jgi:hypothetical protein